MRPVHKPLAHRERHAPAEANANEIARERSGHAVCFDEPTWDEQAVGKFLRRLGRDERRRSQCPHSERLSPVLEIRPDPEHQRDRA